LKRKILVSGSTGQLGQELQFLAKQKDQFEFHFKDEHQFDLTNPEHAQSHLLNSDYDYFINAGAYTAVDNAEDNYELADKVNNKALSYIRAFAPDKCQVVHVSTDYVYNHNPGRPLLESDKTNAENVYAVTKLNGEKEILQRPHSIVIRTSWVYSSYAKNFVKTMQRLGKDKDSLNIVSDQIGTPTYARDLAGAILNLVEQHSAGKMDSLTGLYNYSNLGQTNWADFAKKIFELENIECQVSGITTEAFGAKASRPKWSVLSKQKIIDDFGLEIPHWEESLVKCLEEIRKSL